MLGADRTTKYLFHGTVRKHRQVVMWPLLTSAVEFEQVLILKHEIEVHRSVLLFADVILLYSFMDKSMMGQWCFCGGWTAGLHWQKSVRLGDSLSVDFNNKEGFIFSSRSFQNEFNRLNIGSVGEWPLLLLMLFFSVKMLFIKRNLALKQWH